MPIQTLNPTSGVIEARFDPLNDKQIDQAIDTATRRFKIHATMAFSQRAEHLLALATLLEQREERLARMMTVEMGKPLDQARAEVGKCAWVCRYYADNGESFLADESISIDTGKAFKRYLPLGPVLAVMPWNFPFWQVFRFAAPALMAGNTVLLKHASNVPQCALAIDELVRDAGFDDGTFQTLLIGSRSIEQILRDARVRAVTLTGSGGAGSAVAAIAGEQIKKSVLELGGSDPFIVMPSADMSEAVSAAVTGRTQNNGQSCIAAKRFIVHEAVYDEFRERFVDAFERLTVDDPTDESTDVGPLATEQGRDDVIAQVTALSKQHGKILTGTEVIDRNGFFLRPGVIEAPIEQAFSKEYGEEIFGPVALLFKTSSLEQAIDAGNATPFGLGACLFTGEDNEIELAANQLQAGATFVNTIVASHPDLPFGGVKSSGYGRELSVEGIREFTNLKSVVVA